MPPLTRAGSILRTTTFLSTGQFFVPSGVTTIYCSGCGAGQSGAGGFAGLGGGGGGGGGGSTYFHDYPLQVIPLETLDIIVGVASIGGTPGNPGSVLPLEGSNSWIARAGFKLVEGEPNSVASYLPQPGQAVNGGNGGSSGPVVGNSNNPVIGGIGGTNLVNAGDGGLTKSLGNYRHTGGSGGGGSGNAGFTAGQGGSGERGGGTKGGISGSGGGGGASLYGPAGAGGLGVTQSNGEDGINYGCGGGGGATNANGGAGGPGIVIIYYYL